MNVFGVVLRHPGTRTVAKVVACVVLLIGQVLQPCHVSAGEGRVEGDAEHGAAATGAGTIGSGQQGAGRDMSCVVEGATS